MNFKTPEKGSLIKKVMAFFGLPLLFVFIVYLALYFIASPIINPAMSLLSMMIGDSVPTFTDEAPIENEVEFIPIGAEQEDMLSVTDIKLPNVGEIYAHITIPGTGVDCDVYYGDAKKILKKGPGQYEWSTLPGFGSTTLVAAHVTTHFKGLQYVKVGDIIHYTTSYGAYEYKVTDIKIVKADVAPTTYDLGADRDNLVLYTCYPFTAVAFRSERYMVFADMVSGPKVNIYVD